MAGRPPFRPEDHGLDPAFNLLKFSNEKLLSYLDSIGNKHKPNQTPGMDCSVVDVHGQPGKHLVSTTDFFYPLVTDPYRQGRIAACNVLSDMYAMGVHEIDTVLMILGVCLRMTPAERDVVATEMIRGFSDVAAEAGTGCTGGQTVLNPWPMIGGTAMRTCDEAEMIRPVHGEPGDVLVLTKPLGTQVAVNAMEWLLEREDPKARARWEGVLTPEQIHAAFDAASDSMDRLNRNGAMLMHKHGAHGATDVTGFGILGHASNLAASQRLPVDLELTRLPIIRGMVALNAHVNDLFKLLLGKSAETSGGLLVMLPPACAEAFIADIKALDGRDAWVVGRVVAGTGVARVVDGVEVLEV